VECSSVDCVNGACIYTEKCEVVAQMTGKSLSVDSVNLYWINGSALMFSPIDCVAAGTLFNDTIKGYASDGTNVYWANGVSLMSISASGGAKVTVAPLPADATLLRVDATHAYYSSGSTLYKIPKAGGAAVAMGPSWPVWDLNNYYYDEYKIMQPVSTIYSVPLAGGPKKALATSNIGSAATYLSLSGTDLFWWWQIPGFGNQLHTIPVTGGASKILASTSSQQWVTGIWLDATHVYWLQDSAGTLGLKAVRRDGTGQTSFGPAGLMLWNPNFYANITEVTADADNIYWTATGRVVKTPKPPGF
jgi:hypothetical protein